MTEDYFIDQAIHREDLRGTRSEPTYSGVLSFMRSKYTWELDSIFQYEMSLDLNYFRKN